MSPTLQGREDVFTYPPEIREQPCVVCGKLTKSRYSDIDVGGDYKLPVCKKHNPAFPVVLYASIALSLVTINFISFLLLYVLTK